MKVILTDTFKKQLKKLDAAISKRVLDYLEQVELLIGLSIENIAKATGLTQEEVEALN